MEELDVVTDGSLERFLRDWYGLTAPAPSSSSPRPDLPPPLANWYRLAGAAAVPLTRLNQVLDEPRPEEGQLAFAQEAQHSTLWSYPLAAATEPDPPVFERDWDPDSPWRPTGLRLSRFLLYLAVYDAVCMPRRGLISAYLSEEDFTRAVDGLRPLADELWAWPDPRQRYYAGDGLLAYGGATEDDESFQLFVAATDDSLLARFDGFDWDWDSRRDGHS